MLKIELDRYNSETYNLIINNSIIGWLSKKAIPEKKLYLLHNFYILPQFRSLGYGTHLLNNFISDLIYQKAEQIYLIPEPFELEQKGNKLVQKKLSDSEQSSKLEKLINFYSKFGFEFVNDTNTAETLLKEFNFSGRLNRLMILNIRT